MNSTALAPVKAANPTDSDPDMDEALRRARNGSTFDAALYRLQTEVAYIERDAQLAADVAKDLAASDEDDDSNWVPAHANWVPEANWISDVAAPMPKRTIPADVIEGMWDVVMDGYSLDEVAA